MCIIQHEYVGLCAKTLLTGKIRIGNPNDLVVNNDPRENPDFPAQFPNQSFNEETLGGNIGVLDVFYDRATEKLFSKALFIEISDDQVISL